MPNNSLALTCCSSQLQNLVSLGCHQTKSQLSIIAQQSDSFGCNKWRYSTQPYGYTTTHTLGARKGKTGKLVKVSRGGVLNFKPENTSTKVNGYNFKTFIWEFLRESNAYKRGAMVAMQRSMPAYGKYNCNLIGDYEVRCEPIIF